MFKKLYREGIFVYKSIFIFLDIDFIIILMERDIGG